jgi:hypothetical protein
MSITQPDWKLLRGLKDVALDRYCRRVLEEVAELAADASRPSHERYLELYGQIQARDQALASAFNGLSRSTAVYRLASMRGLDLITDEEYEQFSSETRAAVELLRG